MPYLEFAEKKNYPQNTKSIMKQNLIIKKLCIPYIPARILAAACMHARKIMRGGGGGTTASLNGE